LEPSRSQQPFDGVGLEAAHHQRHGTQQAARPGAQHHGLQPLARERGVALRAGQPLLDVPGLQQGLLGDGERLDQHAQPTRLAWHAVQVTLVVHHELGHEAWQPLDAALAEVEGRAEILAARAAGRAVVVGAPSPHGRDHQH
jgi:hypothetical protein